MNKILLQLLIYGALAFGGYYIWQNYVATHAASAKVAGTEDYSRDLSLVTAHGYIPLKVELATTPDQHQQGMMFRRYLDPNMGMLFIFPDSAIRSFWMKNTLIPLDMVFIDQEQEIIHIHKNAIPEDLTQISSQLPARAVLEIKGGQADLWGLTVGDRIESQDLIQSLQ